MSLSSLRAEGISGEIKIQIRYIRIRFYQPGKTMADKENKTWQIANNLMQVHLEQQADQLELTLLAVDENNQFTPILRRTGPTLIEQPLCFAWIRQAEVEHWSNKETQYLAVHHSMEQGSYHLLMRMDNGSAWLHVQESLAAENQDSGMPVERFEAIWTFQDWHEPGEVFSPHLVPQPGDVIGRHVMRSPALCAQCSKRAAALVIDISSLHKMQDIPAAMNLLRQEHTPVFYTGLRPHHVRDHVYFSQDANPVRTSILQHSYHVWISSRAQPGEALLQSRKKLWGWTVRTAKIKNALAGEEFARHIYPPILAERWIETEYGKKRVGAIRLNRSYDRDVWFCPWFNSLRTAFGLYLWGHFLHQQEWMDKAKMTCDLVLSAPQNHGLFPTVFVFSEKPFWQHSHHQGGGPGIYHLFDMSWTAYQLLRWHLDIQQDQAIISFVKRYGEGLITLQHPDGGLPAYIDSVVLAPVQQVDHQALLKDLARHPGGDGYIPYMLEHHWSKDRFIDSAEDAASLLCLAELVSLLPPHDNDREKFLHTAIKIADYLEKQVFPEAKWIDFEVYYSCSPKSPEFYDQRSGQWPQNTLCLHMAAAGLLRLYKVTRDEHYLQLAEQAMNRLCLYQQVWDPPFLNFNGLGGYGVMNTDGEWNDARQAQFADTHLDFYRLTGEVEHLQRAQAACRAGFTTAFLPENYASYPVGWWRQPKSQAAENHGHSGYDRLCGVSGFDWGSGSALATAAYFHLHGIDW